MRIFVGLELPDAARRAVAERVEALRTRLERAAPHAVFRWVHAGNLHVTIWFIGQVDDPEAARIAEALARPFATTAFALRFGDVGAFPSPARPRVIWTGMADGALSLARLYEEVGQRLEPLGLEPERRPYSAHLTLARVKDLARTDGRVLRKALARPLPPLDPFEVTALTLFRSRLSPRGAQYDSLLRVPLS